MPVKGNGFSLGECQADFGFEVSLLLVCVLLEARGREDGKGEDVRRCEETVCVCTCVHVHACACMMYLCASICTHMSQ